MDPAEWLTDYISDEDLFEGDHDVQLMDASSTSSLQAGEAAFTNQTGFNAYNPPKCVWEVKPPSPSDRPERSRKTLHTGKRKLSASNARGISTRRQHRPDPKPRSAFSKSQINILRGWLDSHISYPYPQGEDLSYLARTTGLQEEQVDRWYTNKRARHTPAELGHTTSDESTQNNPMEAYLIGSLGREVANESALSDASHSPENSSLSIPMSRVGSQSSAGISEAQSTSDIGSTFSQDLFGFVPKDLRKQGRKRRIWHNPTRADRRNVKRGTLQPTSAPSDSQAEPAFYCTFPNCHVQLSSKTWKRHEETKHVSRERYICLRNGYLAPHESSTKGTCVFCGLLSPEDGHELQCSRITDCLGRKESDRTYSRKDHLKQHIKNFHGSQLREHMDTWKEERDSTEVVWSCGFCGINILGWDARALHISKHFRDGYHIRDWNVKSPQVQEEGHRIAGTSQGTLKRSSPISAQLEERLLSSSPGAAHNNRQLGAFTCTTLPILGPDIEIDRSSYPDYLSWTLSEPEETRISPSIKTTQTPPRASSNLNSQKMNRPDLFLDIPEMTNPQSQTTTPIDTTDAVTPTDSTSFFPFTHHTDNTLQHLQLSPSDRNNFPLTYEQWDTHPSPPFLIYTTDNPAGLSKSFPSPSCPPSTPAERHIARLEERINVLEAESRERKSGEPGAAPLLPSLEPDSDSLRGATSFATPPPGRNVYTCPDLFCEAAYRYPLQLLRHRRVVHRERRFQHVVRRGGGV